MADISYFHHEDLKAGDYALRPHECIQRSFAGAVTVFGPGGALIALEMPTRTPLTERIFVQVEVNSVLLHWRASKEFDATALRAQLEKDVGPIKTLFRPTNGRLPVRPGRTTHVS